MRIIPAIDLIDGKCVRLKQGDYSQKKVYNESPLEVAKMLQDNGIRYLHLVDLDGAKARKIVCSRSTSSIVVMPPLAISETDVWDKISL